MQCDLHNAFGMIESHLLFHDYPLATVTVEIGVALQPGFHG